MKAHSLTIHMFRHHTLQPARKSMAGRLGFCVLAAFLVLLTSGCARRLSGKYTDAENLVTLEFRNGKVYVVGLLGTVAGDYTMKGKELILGQAVGQGLVLEIQNDGTLTGFPGGTLHQMP